MPKNYYPEMEPKEYLGTAEDLTARVAYVERLVRTVLQKCNGVLLSASDSKNHFVPKDYEWAVHKGRTEIRGYDDDFIYLAKVPTRAVYPLYYSEDLVYREFKIPRSLLHTGDWETASAVRRQVKELKSNKKYSQLINSRRRKQVLEYELSMLTSRVKGVGDHISRLEKEIRAQEAPVTRVRRPAPAANKEMEASK